MGHTLAAMISFSTANDLQMLCKPAKSKNTNNARNSRNPRNSRKMVKHNNVVPNAHFNKQWQNRVSVNFAQPMKKKRRRLARKAKAAKVAPRPTELLRPVVACSTRRYNMRVKYGRGFSYDELRAAGIKPKLAQTIGIAVDHRRTNKSQEALERNVQRLKEYMSKLILFPKKGTNTKALNASEEDVAAAQQLAGKVLPARLDNREPVKFMRITQEMVDDDVRGTLRKELLLQKRRGQLDKRYEARLKREAEAKLSKKKGKKKKGKK